MVATTELEDGTLTTEGVTTENNNSVEVEVEETVGVVILGILFFFVLMAMLRAQNRERKLLREMADIRAKLAQ